MEIYKVKNYKTFAIQLESKTGCSVDIEVISKDHIHYQLSKMGLSLGVLCVDKGEVSFAPFVTHESARESMYINACNLPMFDDFIHLLTTFREMFLDKSESV